MTIKVPKITGFAALLPILSGGCATYSLATPEVSTEWAMTDERKVTTRCGVKPENTTAITHDFAGAATLIHNYQLAYNCARRQAANGRQHFEVPALLVALGGATAAAFGAPSAVAIATGATTAGLTSAKGYFVPRDKFGVLVAANDAVNCVNTASVGLSGYATALIDKRAAQTKPSEGTDGTENTGGAAALTGDGTIAVSVTDQYFRLVAGALASIDNVAAQRLVSLGSYAPDALMTEIKALKDAQDKKPTEPEKRDAAAQAAALVPASPGAEQVAVPGTASPILVDPASKAQLLDANNNFKAAVPQTVRDQVVAGAVLSTVAGQPAAVTPSAAVRDAASKREAVTSVLLGMSELKPLLQECVLRAKL